MLLGSASAAATGLLPALAAALPLARLAPQAQRAAAAFARRAKPGRKDEPPVLRGASAAAPAQQQQQLQPAEVQEHKRSALAAAVKQLNRKLGSGSLIRLGDARVDDQPAAFIPSGLMMLDIALGGGWPRGRIVEVFGPESSGKSTLALAAIAQVQAAGGHAVLVDAEHAFSPHFAKRLGVNVNDLYMAQPNSGEEALEVVDTMLRSQVVDLIAVDSVAALLPRAELEGDIGQAQVASQARLMSAALRKLSGNAAKSNTTVLFINQLRYKVGVLFGNPETTSGGNALKFYASQRVDVRPREKVKERGGGAAEVGLRVRAKVVKNKVAPPYRSAEFTILFDKGLDAGSDLLEAAQALGLLVARGSHFYLGETRLGQGREAVLAALAGDDQLRAALMRAVREAIQDPLALETALARSDDEAEEDDSGDAAGDEVAAEGGGA